eukprot:Mycagemm_TRINITY_DN9358_c0_g1::TRINITY_DN9358_c0_g1_i1::g.3237::m.3237 type:complete len:106 gc:universal TRINITY_DN9358_c0_g1_i1:631-314(-)
MRLAHVYDLLDALVCLGRLACRPHAHSYGIPNEGCGHRLHGGRPGGAEHGRAARLGRARQEATHCRLEAQIKHPIGLIKYGIRHATQIQCTLGSQVLEATRRAYH